MDCLQEPKDLITVFFGGPMGNEVACFQIAACAYGTRKAYLELV